MVHSQSQIPFRRGLKRLQLLFWQRRFLQGLVRTGWLTLLIPTIVMIATRWFDGSVSWLVWVPLMLLIGLLSMLWTIRPMQLNSLVRRLEGRLGFQAQLMTAYETSREQSETLENNQIAQRLFQETINLTTYLRRRVTLFNMNLWLEIEMLIAVTAMFSALLMLDVLHANVPNAEPIELPAAWQEPRADELAEIDPTLFPPPFRQPPTLSDERIREILETIADSLRDQAVSRPVSESLDQLDVPTAADQVRSLADVVDQLSPEAQQALGQSLSEAARDIGSGAPTFTDPLQSGGSALQNGLTPRGSQALEDLAEALDAVGDLLDEEGQGEGQQGDSGPEQGSQGGQGEGESSEQEQAQEQGSGGGAGEEEGLTEAEESGEGGGQGNQPEAQAGQSESGGQEEGEESTAPGEEAGEEQSEGESGDGTSEEPTEDGEASGAEGQDGDAGSSNQPTEAERLGMEGQPLELEMTDEFQRDDRVLQPSELDAQGGEQSTQDSPFARPLGNNEQLGPDPLSYPWEKRDVIRRYFSGQPTSE